MLKNLFALDLRKSLKYASSIIYLLFVIAFYIYQVNLSLTLIPVAGHDDGLFISMGEKIADGQWLGEFNQFTLMKGVGLSLILAGLSILKISPPVFYGLLIIFTCEVLRRAVSKLWGNFYVAGLISLLVMWYPGLDSTRILRDTLLSWEVTLAFSCFLWFIIKCKEGFTSSLLLNTLGLLLGYIFITREEGLTILVPFIGVIIINNFIINKNILEKTKIYSFIFFLLFAAIPWFAISSLNYYYYGKFIDNDFKEQNFVKTLTLLQSIKSKNTTDFLPVPKDVRLKLYTESPKFAELMMYLDSENAPLSGWKKPPCERFVSTCGDYGGPWFFWALRDAVTMAGHYKSPTNSASYYRELNIEIQNLCSSGKLECRSKLLPLPEISHAQWSKFPGIFIEVIKNILIINSPPLFNMPSIGNSQQLNSTANFLNLSTYIPAVENSDFNDAQKINLGENFKKSIPFLIKKQILLAYKIIMPIILLFGLLGAMLSLVIRPKLKIDSLILSTLWVLATIRVLLLSITSTSGFGDTFHFYIGFSGILLIIASILSPIIFLKSLDRIAFKKITDT